MPDHRAGRSNGRRPTVAENRRYGVLDTAAAKRIAAEHVEAWEPDVSLDFGLPEVDDRYHIWRVPIVAGPAYEKVGEVVIDARTSIIQPRRTSGRELCLERARLALGRQPKPTASARRRADTPIKVAELRNAIVLGDSRETLPQMPAESVGLAFTSPPYFNARPDYSDYVNYEQYLLMIREVIQQVHRVLAEGRFFVMNVAPVLLRRASRSEASKRIAVPFDMHRLFIEEGFEFIDDIIWEKPEGAGWATGRGRRFAADRNPLQYKAVPVTEYVLVYRKATDKLIDWNIRAHPDQDAVARSKIEDDYERTNVWRISPTSRSEHPAVFPVELAERVIRYYSFEGDAVLDPFAGVGTVGEAAAKLNRKFILCEIDADYVDVIRRDAVKWMGKGAEQIMCIGCRQIHAGVLV